MTLTPRSTSKIEFVFYIDSRQYLIIFQVKTKSIANIMEQCDIGNLKHLSTFLSEGSWSRVTGPVEGKT